MGKRARLTGGGKVIKEQANRRHKLEVKSSRRKRKLAGTVEVSKADTKRVKKLLGR
jgi:large subunit ribosomal protein L35